MHALIIEDEMLIALDLADSLEGLGYNTVEMATNESDAVCAAHQRQPDLVTADFNLERGTGVRAVEQICAEHDVPVVFVTSSPGAVLELQPNATVISKPFTARRLSKAVSAAVAVFQMPR